jgi:hypothetical protein
MTVVSAPGSFERLYELGFDGDVMATVHSISPSARVITVPVSTILWHRPSSAEELDDLLDSLLDMGITPSEVHESARRAHPGMDPAPGHGGVHPSSYCEVRVRGELGNATLQYLGWSHRVVETTVVRLHASDEALRSLVGQVSAVSRLDYLLAL